MVSSPSAKRCSASGEKTGSSSPSAGARSAAWSSAGETRNSLDRAVDLLIPVRKRREHGLELRGGDVDPLLEQVPEERPVPLGVSFARDLVEIRDEGAWHLCVGSATEEGQKCADTLDGAVSGKARPEPVAPPPRWAVPCREGPASSRSPRRSSSS